LKRLISSENFLSRPIKFEPYTMPHQRIFIPLIILKNWKQIEKKTSYLRTFSFS